MEFFDAIMTGISTVGFPIVMSIIMIRYMHENDKRYDENITSLRTTIENNTLTIKELSDKINS